MINNICPCCLEKIPKNKVFCPAKELYKILDISYLAQKKLLQIKKENKGKVIKACNHQFCKKCLKKWIKGEKKESCPICRSFANSGIKESEEMRKVKIKRKTYHLKIDNIVKLNTQKIREYGEKLLELNKVAQLKNLIKEIVN